MKSKDKVKKVLLISIIAGSILCVVLTVFFCLRAVSKAKLIHVDYADSNLNNPFGFLGSLSGNSGSGSNSGNSGSGSNSGSSGSGGSGSQGAGQGGTIPYNLDEEDDYLMSWSERINEDVSYEIVWSFDSYESMYGNVSWTYSYYYLEQEGADFTEINEAIRKACGDVTYQYLQNYGYDDFSYNGELYVTGNAYIAYNTDDKISVYSVLAYTENGSRRYRISSANIDLLTGEVFDNSDIFTPDLAFVERFKLQSERQNGYSEVLDMMTDQQVLELLSDDTSSILFFTEKGMEVGFHYTLYQNGSLLSGYYTITLNDYWKYLNEGQNW